MTHFTRTLGSLMVMLWFVISFMGDSILKLIPSPYSEDLVRYKWLILGSGVFLIITGIVSKLKQKRGLNRNDSRWQRNTGSITTEDVLMRVIIQRAQKKYKNILDRVMILTSQSTTVMKVLN